MYENFCHVILYNPDMSKPKNVGIFCKEKIFNFLAFFPSTCLLSQQIKANVSECGGAAQSHQRHQLIHSGARRVFLYLAAGGGVCTHAQANERELLHLNSRMSR